MIRFATREDVKELKWMWHHIFGDEMAYIDLFFEEIFKCDNTLIYDDCGVPVAMMYMVDYCLKQNGKSYKLVYLYALATKEEYRGRGIMNELLDEATKLCKNRDKDALMLIPVNEKLCGYYEKRDFEVVKRILPIKLNEAYECEHISSDEIEIDNGIVLDEAQLHFLQKLIELENVKLCRFKKSGKICRYELCQDKEINAGEFLSQYTIMMKFITNFTVFDEDIISLLLV